MSRPKHCKYCYTCRKPMRMTYPLTHCLDCCVLHQQIHEAHHLGGMSYEQPHGQEERIQKYAAIVASGGRLFEEVKSCGS